MKKRILIIIGVIVALIFVVGGLFIIFHDEKEETPPPDDQRVEKKEYLSANYALAIYEDSKDYLKDKVDLASLGEDGLEIAAKDIIKNAKEFTGCDGTLKIHKDASGIVIYDIASSCEDNPKDNASMDMVIVSNLKGSEPDKQYMLTNFNFNEDGIYEAEISNYIVNGDEHGYALEYNGVYGVMSFEDDLSFIGVKYLDNPCLGINTHLFNTPSGYVITYEKDNEQLIRYMDVDLKTIWERNLTKAGLYQLGKYIYEDDDNMYFEYYSDTNQMIAINKESGKETSIKTLRGLPYSTIVKVDGYLYTYDSDLKDIYCYDLDLNPISDINLEQYMEPESYFSPYVKIAENVIYYVSSNGTINILGLEDGNLMYKIDDLESDGMSYSFGFSETEYVIGLTSSNQYTINYYQDDAKPFKTRYIPRHYVHDFITNKDSKNNYVVQEFGLLNNKFIESTSELNSGEQVIVAYK